MILEQTIQTSYRYAPHPTLRAVHLMVSMEIPAPEEFVDVGVWLAAAPIVAEPLQDALNQRLYNAVHGGLATGGQPLPKGGLEVRLLALRVDPTSAAIVWDDEVERLAEVLEALLSQAVASLRFSAAVLGRFDPQRAPPRRVEPHLDSRQ